MKKKFLILAAALAVFSATNAFSFGIGLQANGNAGRVFVPGVAITAKFDACPLIFAGNWYFGDGYSSIGLTGDWWAINDKIGSSPIMWFFGVGFFTNLGFGDEFALDLGMRVPVGLNAFIGKGVFEPFIQVAPSFGVNLLPAVGASNLFFPISAGFRIWFK